MSEAAAARVREDPDLTPAEKETSIQFAKDEDRARLFTAEAGLTRRLLAHPLFEVDEVVLSDGEYAESVEAIDEDDAEIVGVRGSVPIGSLKVRASSRSRGQHADVVTHTSSGFRGAGE